MIWVVSACFFDVLSFKKLHNEAVSVVQRAFPGMQARFLLLDDSAGTDREIAALKELTDCEVMTLPYNMGHQAALVYGLRRLGKKISDDDFVLTMDSDGEDRPEDIPALLSPLMREQDNASLVALAWRTARKESPGFKISYFFFKLAFRMLTGRVIKNGNFAAFRGWLLKEVIHHPHFDQCYASSFISLPLQIRFVPLPRGSRFFGKSKMSRSALFTHGLRMLMPFTEKIAARGIIASSSMAVLSAVAGFISLFCGFSRGSAGIAFLSALYFGLISVLFVLLFATFSQSKALKLRS